jgi:hypothetical protein
MRARLTNNSSVINNVEPEVMIFPADWRPDVALIRPPKLGKRHVRFPRRRYRVL